MSEVTEDINQDEATQTGRFLVFSLGKEKFGIEINKVTEIIGMQEITEMPDIPEYIKGIVNLRGKIIPVMDVRLRFRMEPQAYDDRTCIIVIDCGSTSIGLIVDSVSEVQTIEESALTVPPNLNGSSGNRYIKNIGQTESTVVLILDCEKMLAADELNETNGLITELH